MTLFDQAQAQTSNILDKIKFHAFIQEIKNGTLSEDKFAYYMQQDVFYLQDYIECNKMITQKISPNYKVFFLSHIEGSIIEQKSDQAYIDQHLEYKTNYTTIATEGYTSHLIKTCSTQAVEIAVAAILACETTYKALGEYLYDSTHNNPYAFWITPLHDPEYIKTVDHLTMIFNELGANTSNSTQSIMLDIFSKSSEWEYYFWDASYSKQIF